MVGFLKALAALATATVPRSMGLDVGLSFPASAKAAHSCKLTLSTFGGVKRLARHRAPPTMLSLVVGPTAPWLWIRGCPVLYGLAPCFRPSRSNPTSNPRQGGIATACSPGTALSAPVKASSLYNLAALADCPR